MSTLRISLRAGEKIFVNGAVVKVDRKTTLEFLNDVTFLLESHVLQPEQATTPMRQLYFIVQMILMNPSDADEARAMFAKSHDRMMKTYETNEVLAGLAEIGDLVAKNRCFEALKRLRALTPVEDAILGLALVADAPEIRSGNEKRLAAGGM